MTAPNVTAPYVPAPDRVADATQEKRGAPTPAATPWPADLDAAVTACVATAEAATRAQLATPDADLSTAATAGQAVDRIVAEFGVKAAAAENCALPPGPTGDERLELDFGRLRGGGNERSTNHAEYVALHALMAERVGPSDAGAQRQLLDRSLSALRQSHGARVVDVLAAAEARLAAAEARYADLAARAAHPAVDEADLRVATAVAEQLRALTPAHGLPLVAYQIRDAAATGRLGAIRALVPVLKSVYERAGEYAGHADLWALISKAEAITPRPEARVAAARLAEITVARRELHLLDAAVLDRDPRDLRTAPLREKAGVLGRATRLDGTPIVRRAQ